MGQIKRVIVSETVPVPEHNKRLCVELCENVHLHYRNLRLEFSKRDFIQFLDALRSIHFRTVTEFEYGPNAFKELINIKLPDETEFNDRLQIEEQVEGHYHIHYRNLRIEVSELAELFGKKV